MNDKELLSRITLNPTVVAGKPVIRGTRLTVEYIIGLLAHGASYDEILAEYPSLAKEDIQASLLFATRFLADSDMFPLLPAVA